MTPSYLQGHNFLQMEIKHELKWGKKKIHVLTTIGSCQTVLPVNEGLCKTLTTL